ncbi:S8 family serine peptidase [Abyssisolibacter fermentans]|uniref:S8 family serine peptidase n=1 Tax=Abyssisolibacter fermentans TaxID=1766203 RepID=UPI00082E2E0B|nr:S8 family serine peptidase [Abyssisolibacter fermentans]
MFSRRVLSILMCVLVFLSLSSYGLANDKTEKEEIIRLFDADGDKLTENLFSVMEEVSADELIPVIVVYKENQFKAANNEVSTLMKENKVKHAFKNIPAVALSLSKEKIEELKKSDMVEHIEYDEEVKICLDDANYWFGTEKARNDFGIDGNKDGSSSYSKNDVVVAVIDTGIDASHVDLDGGKVIGWKDFVNNQTTPYDDNSHGTHCAGIVAGEGQGNANYKGVAPGAALVGVKVLDSNGSGSMSDVTAGIDWCITNKNAYGIDVISMSLGTSGSSDGTDSTSLAVNNAVNAGITVAVAAGNSGPKKYTIGSPGAATGAITVANMIDVGEKGFALIYHSSRGPTADDRIKPDIAAPGTNISAPYANSTNDYISYTGTSMATPFTAGTIALMLDADSSLTPAQIRNIITSTAIDWGKSGQDTEYGHGRLDAYAAIKQAGGFTGSNIAVPDHMHKAETLADSREDIWEFDVDDTNYPIAITLIIPDWTSFWWWGTPDFDIKLIAPNGSEVASQNNSTRQRTITYYPVSGGTGTYKIKIESKDGSGDYFFDLSCNGGNLTLTQDQ